MATFHSDMKQICQSRFRRVLVANRGEIALRIIRALRELGIESVAVYSEADADAPFVTAADQAILLGPAAPRASYLNEEKVLAAARESGADGIHPGYGFFSENTDFAARCADAGITFIGPSAAVIRLMGDKMAARQAAIGHDVPVVPGMESPAEDPAELREHVARIGFPLLVKAAHGGGGKGMRRVDAEADLEAALKMAIEESTSSFGSPAVYLERCIGKPRHIEIQVACDQHGQGVWFPERECSVQRRHQKLIEESPSPAPAMTPELRQRMGSAALRLALSSGYDSVGTVEFLLDEDGSFYFLEMNTRLQVEHPVTEMVTGVDLVKLQIAIAAGFQLPFEADHLPARGHAIECRVCAEDPFRGFMPASGRILDLHEPSGPGTRVDSGVVAGGEISMSYDSMIAKLICHGADRSEAIDRSLRALAEYRLHGLETTLPFHRIVLDSAPFHAGDTTTDFIDRYWDGLIADDPRTDARKLAVLAATLDRLLRAEASRPVHTDTPGQGVSAWRFGDHGWRG